MTEILEEAEYFIKKQGYVIVSTISKDGSIHNSCKGILMVKTEGQIYLLDLYLSRTYHNLKENNNISICAADEHSFSGYCLKGKARIIPRDKLEPDILKAWDNMIVSRLSNRLIKNMREKKGHRSHPEALLPRPKYMIMIDVAEIVDLTPKHLK